MSFARLTTRLIAGGATAALATAGLVGMTSTAAHAAPVSTTYNCTVGSQTFPVSATVDIALLPSSAPAGLAVPAGLLSFNSTLTVPDAVQSQLNATINNTGAKSDDFGTAFGDAVAKAPVAWTKPAAATNGNWVYTGKGANAAFQLPAAGTYAVTMPKSFTLVTTGGAAPVTAACTAPAAPATIGSITLSKQASKTKATAKSVKVGKPVVVTVTVTDDQSKMGGVIPSGKLIVKDGKKKVGSGKLDAKGKAKISVKGLAAGSHSLTVIYKGDGYNEASTSKAKTVKVTK